MSFADDIGKPGLVHIAASKGHEECMLVLLKHGCNVHLQDMEGNTALWEAIASKHYPICQLLFNFAALSDPFIAGDLLCTASNKYDTNTMKELLKHGLHIDSRNRHGQTALQIAMKKKNTEMVKLLVMNGADVVEEKRLRNFDHRINVLDLSLHDAAGKKNERDSERHKKSCVARVSIYIGQPLKKSTQTGRLIKLPNSLTELKNIAGEKFGINATNALVLDAQGAEIDSIEVIRDNDKIYILEDPNT